MDTIFVTEKLILHAEKEQLLGISFWDELGSDCCKLHAQTLSEPVPIKNLKNAIDLYMEDDEKEINEKNIELARDWVTRELAYCILTGRSVEFHSLNGGADLKIQISKCGKNAYQIIPVSTTVQFYMKIWEVMNTLRQDIMNNFPNLEQEYKTWGNNMSKALKCDRCGKFFELKDMDEKYGDRERIYHITTDIYSPRSCGMDLCPECYGKLENGWR